MGTPRLASKVAAQALIRLAQGQNGFGMVIARGDETSGGLLVQLLEKGVFSAHYERVLASDGDYKWSPSSRQVFENKEEMDDYLERRRNRDPDLWILELDIPDAQRFIAECLSGA